MSVISLIEKIPFGTSAEKGFFLYTHMPESLFSKIAGDNFRGTVLYAYEHSRFYRRKFDELKINPKKIKKPDDLGDFFTTAEDLRENVQDFVCARPDTAYETTGTTSKKPKRVYFSRQEVKEAGWSGAVGLWGLGVRAEDRVASAFDYSFWVSGPVLQASCEVLGCFHVEACRIPPDEFYDRVKDYGITVIVGDPSWIVRLSEIAEKKGAWPVKLLLAGGENMTEDSRQYVEKIWKSDFLLGYGQTEAFGAIGMESRAKEGYHLNEFHNLFEIINPDTDGYGELVYTTANRRVMPLIRYRSGDITKFLEGPSKSGLPGKRIAKLKGRMNEWVATGMGNLTPWMFEPVFRAVGEISEDWQVVILRENLKDLVEFHVESLDGTADPERLRARILASLEKQLPEAWNIYKMGILKLDLKVHPKGSLRTERKLLRIVDKRQF